MKTRIAIALLAALPWIPPASAQDAAAVDPAATAVANPLAAIPESAMTAFLGRPLFTPTRRPAAPAPVAVAAPSVPAARPPPSADHLRLVGTLRTDGATSALIEDTGRGTLSTLSAGDRLDGWAVAEITGSAVRLEQGDRRVTLELFRPGAPVPPAGAARPALSSSAPATSSAPSASADGAVTVAPSGAASGVPSAPAGAPPPGTVAGTAAAEIAAQSPFRLTFGTQAPPAE